jgi:hypothetical protein
MKLNHNRAITIADRMSFGDKQQMTEHEKNNLELQKKAMAKKTKKNLQKYGSIEAIRKARMEKYLKSGWTKINENK